MSLALMLVPSEDLWLGDNVVVNIISVLYNYRVCVINGNSAYISLSV